ncbi:HAD family phosphatase [Paraburkholderia fungorum]|uniref:Phosphoserine phosphatase n=1 Tax=Paraburkholderia fungorum TaxID=134537 RepID=A0A420GT66_9BURK|nr:HAD family hydrolase [Paraburkholderia fungorum]RKF48347.1 phosphoserine phosphatase [Paraburkholderia fungorum]
MTYHPDLALFDLDHTLLPLDSDQEWNRFLVKLGVVGGEQHARDVDRFYDAYQAGTLDMAAYLNHVLAPLARHPREQLDTWHAQFMREIILPALQPAALALVRHHQEAGDLCCLVTATNAFVTQPIARALGFYHLLAIDLATDGNRPDGHFTGEWIGVPSFREGKITRTEAWLASLGRSFANFGRSWFYSDSVNDIPLLERVSNPVATNPDDRLRHIAGERDWPILELFDPTGGAGQVPA